MRGSVRVFVLGICLLAGGRGVAGADDKQAEALSDAAMAIAEGIVQYGGGILLQSAYMSFGRVFNDIQMHTSAWGGQIDLLVGFDSPVGVILGGAAYVPVHISYAPPPGKGRAVEGEPEGASLSAATATLGPAFYVGSPEGTRLVIGMVMHWSTIPMYLSHGVENSDTWGAGAQLIALHPIGRAVTLNVGVRGHVDLTSLSHGESHSISFNWGASAGVGFRL